MKETRISIPELVMVAGTRAVLGAGVGLLLANRLSVDERKAIGWALVAVGVLSSIPLALEIFGGDRISTPGMSPAQMADNGWSESSGHRLPSALWPERMAP
jgi:hypothetical protein